MVLIGLEWIGTARDQRIEKTLEEQGQDLEEAGKRLDGQQREIEDNRIAIEREKGVNDNQGKAIQGLEGRVLQQNKLFTGLRDQLARLEAERGHEAGELEALRERIAELEQLAGEERDRLLRIERHLGIVPPP